MWWNWYTHTFEGRGTQVRAGSSPAIPTAEEFLKKNKKMLSKKSQPNLLILAGLFLASSAFFVSQNKLYPQLSTDITDRKSVV